MDSASLVIVLLASVSGCWLLAPMAVIAGCNPSRNRDLGWVVGLGAAGLLAAAAFALGSSARTFTLPGPFHLGLSPVSFHLDALAGWFLAVLALVTVALALYIPSYAAHLARHADIRPFRAAMPLFLLSMAAVMVAGNAPTFLVAWEVMSLSSFALVATDHARESARRAALVYLGATRLGTAFLFGGFLWIHALTGSWTFADWRLQGAAALGPGLLLLAGLGVKAGVWPFHLWLPIAHPAAPAPASALMSGVMVKVPIYLIVRLFVLSPALSHPMFGYILVALGAVSAFWGVLFAILQHDLKRLLAFHTVENVGLILMGVGGAIVAHNLGLPITSRLALAAGLFHVMNHAVFKSLLFMGAGAVDLGAGTRDLERLGGLGRRMPVTFVCFVLGSAAICALPPLNGFASEWLLYQSMFGVAGSAVGPLLRFLSLLMVGWLALVGALALACFVKAVGVAFLGRPRSEQAGSAMEVSSGMRIGQIALAVVCAALGIGAPWVMRVLHPVVLGLAPGGAPLEAAWTLPTGALLLTFGVTAAAATMWLQRAAAGLPVKSYITWECGFGPLSPRMQTTAMSFAQPICRMFGALFSYAVNLRIDGANRRLFPADLTVEPSTESVLESRVYGPLIGLVNRLGGMVVRLQAGSIHLYLLTMFLTLIVLLAAGRYL